MLKKLKEEIKRIKYVLSHSPMSKEMETKMIGKLSGMEKQLRELKSGNRELNLEENNHDNQKK